MFAGPFDFSIIKRAQDKKILDLRITDLRSFATDKYKSVDDRPYGGGAGMVLRVDIIDTAVSKLKAQSSKLKVILLDAGGKKFNQKLAQDLSHDEHLIIICGHYEGVDHRVHEHIADEVISIGDYVLSGGEIPAMVVVDTIVRLLPGALGNPDSLTEESFNQSMSLPADATLQALQAGNVKSEYAQYTRPEEYKGWNVPEILLSGDHAKIKKWRAEK